MLSPEFSMFRRRLGSRLISGDEVETACELFAAFLRDASTRSRSYLDERTGAECHLLGFAMSSFRESPVLCAALRYTLYTRLCRGLDNDARGLDPEGVHDVVQFLSRGEFRRPSKEECRYLRSEQRVRYDEGSLRDLLARLSVIARSNLAQVAHRHLSEKLADLVDQRRRVDMAIEETKAALETLPPILKGG